MSWTQDHKLDSMCDDRLYRSFTDIPATMYVRSDQLQTGTMYPLRAFGGIKGEHPLLTPFSLGYRFFWARKRNGNKTLRLAQQNPAPWRRGKPSPAEQA